MKNLGKFLYIIPMALFGLMHFANANQMVGIMPDWLPLKTVLVYLSGLGLIAAPVALIIKNNAKLAMNLLGVELLLIAVLIHFINLIGGDAMSIAQVLKDVALAGGAFYIAGTVKK
jgi:uncharacterized membrane protein